MKPTIFEIYGTNADTGEQITFYKLVSGNITINQLFEEWRKRGIIVHWLNAKEIDLPPDELIFYLNQNFEF